MNSPLRTPWPRLVWLVLLICVSANGRASADDGGWSWKRATSTDDLMSFLNGTEPYTEPVGEFRISATRRGGGLDFFVFYRRLESSETPASWSWKLATTPEDAYNFLNGVDPYGSPVLDAQIAVVGHGESPRFYIVYQFGGPDDGPGAWGWKPCKDATDVMRFLNGQEPYRHPVTTARIAELTTGLHDEFFVFYQRNTLGTTIANWAWKRSTDVNDALNFINGSGAYGDPVHGYDIGAIGRGSWTDFHVFSNQGTAVWLQGPLENERFVSAEPVPLRALVTSDRLLDGLELAWSSSVDGALGSGPALEVDTLSAGMHQISVEGYGVTASTPARVFRDLWALYQAEPAPAEIDRIRSDFTLDLVDGTGTDESWTPYGLVFDQTSTDPSEMVAIAKLDVLRHQRFSEPLPFSGGKTIYEHLSTHVHTLNLTLECRFNTSGGGQVWLARNFSVWDPRLGTTAEDPEACKQPFSSFQLNPYVGSLKLLVHEGRHSEPDDPGHSFCDDRPKDMTLEGGSGYAQGALYDMWVYKYGLYDPPAIKELAKAAATGALQAVFCSTPTHSDPRVQAIVDELLEP